VISLSFSFDHDFFRHAAFIVLIGFGFVGVLFLTALLFGFLLLVFGDAVADILFVDGDVFFLQLGIAGEEEGFHREDQPAVVHIEFNDFEGQDFTHEEGFFGVLQLGNGQMGDGDKPFHHIVIQLDVHQHAFGDELADFAFDLGVDGEYNVEVFPGIGTQLLDAQGDAMESAID